MKEAFEKLDTNKDGTVNVAELKSCECVKKMLGPKATDV